MLDALYQKLYAIPLDPEQIECLIVCDCGSQLKRKRESRGMPCDHECHNQNEGGSTHEVWQCGSGCGY